MKQVLIINANIVTENSIKKGHCLLIDGGQIKRIAEKISSNIDNQKEIVDASNLYLCPGFIDLHLHGVHTYLVDNGSKDLDQICRILPKYGVTGFLPTVCPLPKGQDSLFLRSLTSTIYPGAQILGFHLEGPFLSITGALPPDALGNADLDRVNRLIAATQPYKAIFSISPEFPSITNLLPAMTTHQTPAFITHTRANVWQTLEAIQAGACHATHFYDVFYAPEAIEPGVRPCGAVEAILANQQTTVDFILDGVHVDPIAVKMALQAKGKDGVCLITDANIGAGLGAGTYQFGGQEVKVVAPGAPARLAQSNGLAGSGLTMNLAVKNAVHMLGVDLPLAVKMASANPARVLGLLNKGKIAEGYDADLVLLDDSCTVIHTWIKGNHYYNKNTEKL